MWASTKAPCNELTNTNMHEHVRRTAATMAKLTCFASHNCKDTTSTGTQTKGDTLTIAETPRQGSLDVVLGGVICFSMQAGRGRAPPALLWEKRQDRHRKTDGRTPTPTGIGRTRAAEIERHKHGTTLTKQRNVCARQVRGSTDRGTPKPRLYLTCATALHTT